MEDNWLNELSLVVDRNRQQFQLGLYAVTIGGFVYALRSVRPKFRHARQIPQAFIDHKVTLNGTVQKIDVGSPVILRVDHTPIFASRLRRRKEPGLAVNICSVNVSSNGISWLQLILLEKKIRFTLLKKEEDFVHCIVYFEGKKNVAEELLKLGFATVDVIDFDLENDKLYSSYYKSLIKLENKAEKERVGVWSNIEPAAFEKIKMKLRSALHNVFQKFNPV